MASLLGGAPEPTVPDSNISLFPGNINCFVIENKSYNEVLDQTSGLVGEFINPKYVPDSNRTKFLKPTRVECMMQDYAKLLPAEIHGAGRVGHSQFPKWTSFSAVKNDLKSGVGRQAKGIGTETASTGEADMYSYYRKSLSGSFVDNEALVSFEPEAQVTFAGINVPHAGRVVLSPAMSVTLADTHAHFQPESKAAISVSQKSSLVLDAPDLVIRSLALNGALKISAVKGAEVTVQGLTVTNQGSALVALEEGNSLAEEIKIRGYQVVSTEESVYVFNQPGKYVLSDETKSTYAVSSNL